MTEPGYKGWIPALSFAFLRDQAFSNGGIMSTPTGFAFTKEVDSLTTRFALAVQRGESIDEITIAVGKLDPNLY